jgi:hypothetical protein
MDPNVSCGAQICGAPTTPSGVAPGLDVKGPTAMVELGLGVHPGLSPEDAARAGKALALLRTRLRSCVNRALASEPTLVGQTITMRLMAQGNGAQATISVVGAPFPHAAAQSCMQRLLTTTLGEDVAPVSLELPMRIRIDPP